ncbi:DUF2568 domain-containing protein [Nocardia sp. NPDC049220]|uniref:DUF2568 domain-containing protein n=1 Tax=Nocardia sp. NPDC049220 TaxID=3155273 RepID=UPI003408005D
MSEVWKWANLMLAFVMELVALAALALWGWKAANETPVKLVLAVGIPLLAAVAWALVAAPNATFDHPLLAVVTKLVVFGCAAVGLCAVHYRVAVVVFVANLLVIKLGHLTP